MLVLAVVVWAIALTAGIAVWSTRTDTSAGAGSAVPPNLPEAPGGTPEETPPPSPEPEPDPEDDRSERPSRSDPPASKKPKKKEPQIPVAGPGTYDRQQQTAKPAGDSGQVLTYDVRVEKGLPYRVEDIAKAIHTILNDERSWTGTGDWRFELVGPGEEADLHAYLVTPKTTDKLCAPLLTGGEVSCRNGEKVVLNAKRWAFGAEAYGDDVANYRRYLVNHEFGHALGFGHVGCPGRGRPAPIMMQQTKGVDGCRPNPWPAGDDE